LTEGRADLAPIYVIFYATGRANFRPPRPPRFCAGPSFATVHQAASRNAPGVLAVRNPLVDPKFNQRVSPKASRLYTVTASSNWRPQQQ